jgi:GNAT superfamily N-acetyltransferase
VELHFRPYRPADAPACLALFDGNVPRAFATSERDDFAAFLAAPPCPYLVGTAPGGEVLACGGWFQEPDAPTVGGLAWGIVHRHWQGRGLGQALLEVRLAALAQVPGVRTLVVRTSPTAEGFFARAGFVAVRRIPDGHAPGIDRVDMERPVPGDASGS